LVIKKKKKRAGRVAQVVEFNPQYWTLRGKGEKKSQRRHKLVASWSINDVG
jgi:hypothetical protein